MAWLQLSLPAGDSDPQQLADFFEQQGALSVTLVDSADEPIFEPDPGTTPLWSATTLTALFDQKTHVEGVRESLASAFGQAVADRLSEAVLEDRDWEREWLDHFRPMRFGQRLWVCPAGQLPDDNADPVIIDLDPGLAFGTGTHPTTALCLQWLDGHPPRKLDVLDYGCGSGILGIAAMKLGAASTWAIDIDTQALWASRDNAAHNGIEQGFHTGLPEELPDRQFDLLLANILANPLVELAGSLQSRVRAGGALVLSGVLSGQAQSVMETWSPWFDMDKPVELEDWVRLTGIRKSS